MRIGLIGGSAFPKDWNDWAGFRPLAQLTAQLANCHETAYGQAASRLQGVGCGSHEVVFLARHGQSHDLLPHEINYRANLQALQGARVDCVLATHTVGGIDPAIGVGALVIPDQLLDYTHGRAATFGGEGNILHVDFTQPFDAGLQVALLAAGKASALDLVAGGVYACTQGPRLETAAEVNRLERDGASLIGMTAMPEAVLARELALPFASISLVVNAAAGRGDFDDASIAEAGRRGMQTLSALLLALFSDPQLFLQ